MRIKLTENRLPVIVGYGPDKLTPDLEIDITRLSNNLTGISNLKEKLYFGLPILSDRYGKDICVESDFCGKEFQDSITSAVKENPGLNNEYRKNMREITILKVGAAVTLLSKQLTESTEPHTNIPIYLLLGATAALGTYIADKTYYEQKQKENIFHTADSGKIRFNKSMRLPQIDIDEKLQEINKYFNDPSIDKNMEFIYEDMKINHGEPEKFNKKTTIPYRLFNIETVCTPNNKAGIKVDRPIEVDIVPEISHNDIPLSKIDKRFHCFDESRTIKNDERYRQYPIGAYLLIDKKDRDNLYQMDQLYTQKSSNIMFERFQIDTDPKEPGTESKLLLRTKIGGCESLDHFTGDIIHTMALLDKAGITYEQAIFDGIRFSPVKA